MRPPQSFKDSINDVAFDFYGRRLAVCSIDHTVKIFDKIADSESSDDGTGDSEWRLSYSWRAHTGSVWRVCWAHPEFGQLLATCSVDRQVAIWEEVDFDQNDKTSTASGCFLPTQASHHRRLFKRRASIVDSKSSVSDVRFAPKHIGLMLAMTSHDGTLRIYEAVNPFQLSEWTMRAEVNSESKAVLNCVCWSNNRLHCPLVAVGADESVYLSLRNLQRQAGQTKLFLYEGFLDSDNKDWRAVNESNYHLLDDGRSTYEKYPIDAIKDLEFAPSNGRSYHLLAAAVVMPIAQKSAVILYKMKPLLSRKDHQSGSSSGGANKRYSTVILGQYNIVQLQSSPSVGPVNKLVWRVKWNLLGSVIASICTDGEVSFTKYCPSVRMDFWEELGAIKHDGKQRPEDVVDRELSVLSILPQLETNLYRTLAEE